MVGPWPDEDENEDDRDSGDMHEDLRAEVS